MDEKALILRWIETWKRAGPALEAIRRRELEALTDDDVRLYVQQIHGLPLPPGLPPRVESGLVEQQRWFARLHRHE
jgi:hypothetical protein